MENEPPFQLHLLQRFAQLQHGGNYATQQGKQTRDEKYRSQKRCGRKKPACHQRQATHNQDRDSGQEKLQRSADQAGTLGYLKSLGPQHFEQLLTIPGPLFCPFLLFPEHSRWKVRNRATRAARRP